MPNFMDYEGKGYWGEVENPLAKKRPEEIKSEPSKSNVEPEVQPKTQNPLDINKDGKVDKEDAKLASKVMNDSKKPIYNFQKKKA